MRRFGSPRFAILLVGLVAIAAGPASASALRGPGPHGGLRRAVLPPLQRRDLVTSFLAAVGEFGRVVSPSSGAAFENAGRALTTPAALSGAEKAAREIALREGGKTIAASRAVVADSPRLAGLRGAIARHRGTAVAVHNNVAVATGIGFKDFKENESERKEMEEHRREQNRRRLQLRDAPPSGAGVKGDD